MKAVILCGGRGERMWPLCEDKWALDFLGRPLLLHLVDLLHYEGVREFVFVGNPATESKLCSITSRLTDVSCGYAVQPEHSGMAGALEAAAEHLTGPFLLVSSNDIVEASAYRSVIDEGRSGRDCALLACRLEQYFPGGYLVTDEENSVRGIEEKPEPGSEPSDLVNVVVHYHRDPAALLLALSRAETEHDDRYESSLSLLIESGTEVLAVPYDGFWSAIKYPWDVLQTMDHFVNAIQPYTAPTASVAPSAVVDGRVHIGDNVKVLENAVVRGPAYIADNCVIGNNALIRGGVHLGEGSVVGYSTEVKHSYIGRNCWFHSNYIGDSVIDDSCLFGSGAVTGNFRFDEAPVKAHAAGKRIDTGSTKLGVIMGSGCHTGINAGFMPGVLVGPGAEVGPHVCLTANLAAGQKARLVDDYRVDNDDSAPGSAG
ncbi:MAG: NTP transferase domain-containing protein [Armatimonadia bacterium]|nr:NTP transferase domain-containing protein [Armatimonadia bacterium]